MDASTISIESSWKAALIEEFSKEYFKQLVQAVKTEYKKGCVYPPGRFIFRALELTPVSEVKVVILGQDPYHGPGQANGLCFSVAEGVKLPPSLVNIFKEIQSDLGKPVPENGNLERWAKQGVLLLNATLTVQAHQAGSHQNMGWEIFTDAIVKKVSDRCSNVVFMLWGSYARKKGLIIDRNRHKVLESPHPSPLSAHRGFFGNKHFSKANKYLLSVGKSEIEW